MTNIFFSPHNDDEALFGAYTLMRHRKDIQVVVVYDSYVQVARGHLGSTMQRRRNETCAALQVMGVVAPPMFLGLDDRVDYGVEDLLHRFYPRVCEDLTVYAPAWEEDGHKHHNLVARVARRAGWMNGMVNLRQYLTYTSSGKSTSGCLVLPEIPEHIELKRTALSLYESQLAVPDCRPHFLRSQEEYLVP